MTYPRVNLLKKSEQRYQGMVSRRFILVVAVLAPVLLVAVLSGIKLMQYSGIQSDLKAGAEIWKELEPKLALFNKQKSGFDASRQALSLFDGWGESQISMEELLNGIQDAVPENIQLTRLSIRGDLSKTVYKDAAEMKMDSRLVIEGTSLGARTEEDVIKFQRDLIGREEVSKTFGEINLDSMRKRQGDGELVQREFRLEGKTAGKGEATP